MSFNRLNLVKVAKIACIAILALPALISATPAPHNPIKIVTTTVELAGLAKEIGGNHIQVTPLIKGSKDLHQIAAKPSMVVKAKSADAIIRVGMGLDSWVDGVIDIAKNKSIWPGQPGYINASKTITKLDVPTHHVHQGMGDVHIEGNPHYWLDPHSAILIARQITEYLSQTKPELKATFQDNQNKFEKKLNAKINQWKQELSAFKDHNYISYHSTWAYFAKAFQLNIIDTIEPKPGIPPTPRHLKKLGDTIESHHVAGILIANYFPQKAAKKLYKKHHTPIITLPTSQQSTNSSYIEFMDKLVKDVKTLSKAKP